MAVRWGARCPQAIQPSLNRWSKTPQPQQLLPQQHPSGNVGLPFLLQRTHTSGRIGALPQSSFFYQKKWYSDVSEPPPSSSSSFSSSSSPFPSSSSSTSSPSPPPLRKARYRPLITQRYRRLAPSLPSEEEISSSPPPHEHGRVWKLRARERGELPTQFYPFQRRQGGVFFGPHSFLARLMKNLRSFRKFVTGGKPWTLDRLYAIFSLIALGTTTWVVIGTTTAFSAVIVLANTLQFQEYLVDKIGQIVTHQTGFKVEFEYADVASWVDSAITLKNVILSREGTKEGCKMNYTIEEVQVKLSLRKYIEGGGILKEVKVNGVRGASDSTMVSWDIDYPKLEWNFGDFDLEKVECEDFQAHFYLPWYNSPLKLSIFRFSSDRLRRQWMLFDILTANYIQGSLNNCLFNLSESDPLEEPKPLSSSPSPSPSASSRKITIDPSMPQLEDDEENNEAEEKYEADNYTTREFKLHQLPIDLLTAGTTGPLSWITSGYVDISFRSRFPITHKHRSHCLSPDVEEEDNEDIPVLMDVTLKHLTAKVPVSSPDLTYIQSASVRPVVAFMNTNYTEIPLNLKMNLKLGAFDGAWYLEDAKVNEHMSEAFGRGIEMKVQEQKQPRRLRELVLIGLDGLLRGCAHVAYCAFELYI